jgi:hypothetical protein
VLLVLSGHGLQAASQIVLGPATLAQLHKHVGDTVVASTGQGPPFRLLIVGTTTLPTIGGSGSPSLQMGTGAIVAATRFPAQALNPQGSPVAGPMAVFITIRPGVTPAAARHSLDQVTSVLNRPSAPDSPVGGAVSVLRPAEIANYRTVGSTPAVLAAILAAGGVGALGITLIASVRRRRRELALLNAGFHPAATGHHGGLAVVGVGARRDRRRHPARHRPGTVAVDPVRPGDLSRPDPAVPVLSLAVVAAGAMVFANLVAVFSGRVAARTPTALLLRAE